MPWDSTKKCTHITLSNSDRTATMAAEDANGIVLGTQGRSTGKYYFEIKMVSPCETEASNAGISRQATMTDWCDVPTLSQIICCQSDGAIYDESSLIGDLGDWADANDILMVAVDLDNGKMWFGVNGTWYNSGDPSAGTNASATFSTGNTWYPWSRQNGCGGGA